jgi:hypothetical protein
MKKKTTILCSMEEINICKLEPNFISGFSDGESSFSVSFSKDKEYKTG